LISTVEEEIRDLILRNGPITFAQFMHTCLYSPRGGFYSTRGARISTHFGTSSTSHPLFGALIARQLEQMWHILGNPAVFHLVEVGCGDGSLANSIMDACRRQSPPFAQAIRYIATDYQPQVNPSPGRAFEWHRGTAEAKSSSGKNAASQIQRVKGAGLGAFRNIVGCVLSNELIDNFPVHRFEIQGGRVREVFITLVDGRFAEVLGEPSSAIIEERLTGLGVRLPEGFRGEVNPDLEDWTLQLTGALDRGFVLTIDYGELASDLYSLSNSQGTLVCYSRHAAGEDPYQNVGQQDITCLVDFTSLMELGEQLGLKTVGYTRQSQFVENLGLSSFLDELPSLGLSAARTELNRMAMMTLVDPEEYGNFKVVAQAKGVETEIELLGFESQKI
jgi:SAM-dependent MidA family methyltransferase